MPGNAWTGKLAHAMETRASAAPLPRAFPDLEDVLDSLASSECVYFPIRHHSPACAWHVGQLIRELRPPVVLVEGPISFTPLIPTVLDPGTRPPIAIYTHFIDVDGKLQNPKENEPAAGPARFAAYYPFCEYSPELIALRCGQEVGARLRFIDLDYADQVLAEHAVREKPSKPRVETLMREKHLQRSLYLQALAQRCGCRDFNEMWDHLFEANFRQRSIELFMREIATYCFLRGGMRRRNLSLPMAPPRASRRWRPQSPRNSPPGGRAAARFWSSPADSTPWRFPPW